MYTSSNPFDITSYLQSHTIPSYVLGITTSIRNTKPFNQANTSQCKPDHHKPRNNKYGITWCIKCGELFNKPCNKELQLTELIIFTKQ